MLQDPLVVVVLSSRNDLAAVVFQLDYYYYSLLRSISQQLPPLLVSFSFLQSFWHLPHRSSFSPLVSADSSTTNLQRSPRLSCLVSISPSSRVQNLIFVSV